MPAMKTRQTASVIVAALTVALLTACGGSSSSSQTKASSTQPAGAGPTTSAPGAGALSAEAASAATGDIPDTQAFLTFRNPAGGYAIQYPEGWAQRGAAADVTFQDKNNVIHAALAHGGAPTAAAVTAQLAQERTRVPSLTYGTASAVAINGAPVLKISYSTLSQPNSVTGRRVQLLVDRYVYSHGGKILTVDLGTPKGVDNIDAYKKIARSLRWL
jgi:hypothetical protein